MSVDVLFIHPGGSKQNYQELSGQLIAFAPPIWPALIAEYIRKEGYTAAIYDANLEGWDELSAGRIIARYKPKLTVIMAYGHHPSASTQAMPYAGKIARALKGHNRDMPVALGGTHPSALPERTLKEEDVDFVIQGEGIYAVKGLLDYLNGKKGINNAHGLWFRQNTQVRLASVPEVVKDLNKELKGYAWDLLPALNNYRAHNMHCFQDFQKSKKEDFSDVRSPYVTLYTSLGCPYSCAYCCVSAIFGKPTVRYWPVETVISWIDILAQKYGVRNIRIEDELFILSEKRVEAFCDALIDRGYGLNIWAYARVDTVRKHLLKKLKKAGVNWICLGIESVSAAARKKVNKDIRADIKKAVRLIQAEDIYVLGNYIFGLPGEDNDDMEATFQYAQELNCEYANFYSLMAYPGSRLYNEALKKKGVLPESWDGFAQLGYEAEPLPGEYLSAKDILGFRDKAFRRYFTNPDYLDMISLKFKSKTRRHIENMADIEIKRRILEDA